MPKRAEAADPGAAARIKRALAALVIVMAGVLAIGAPAQAADPQDGYRLAKKWCTSCHIVGPGETGSDAARPTI